MLPKLPADVVSDLCRWLPQAELLSLALTSKEMHALAHPELYRCIVVDSSKRAFLDSPVDDRVDCFVSAALVRGQPVVIRSLFALSWFFKTVLQNPAYARHVRCLVFHDNVPDIPAFEMTQYLRSLFPLLANLEVLNWYSQTHPLDSRAVALLPHPEKLASLCGNFSFVVPEMPVGFGAVRRLDISNFGSQKVLQGLDLGHFPSIDSLTLSRSISQNSLHFSSACCQNSGTSQLSPQNLSANYVRSLFNSPLQAPLRLSTLVLRDIPLAANDALLLKQNIDLRSLSHLTIDNCTEVLFESEYTVPQRNTVQISRRNPPALMFLDTLAPELGGLTSLNVGLSNELCHNNSTFKALARLPRLTKVSVHLKMFQSNDPVSLAPLVNALAPHADTLEYLDLCCELVEQPSIFVCPKIKSKYVLRSLLGLSRLKRLRYLRLPVTFEQISEIPVILSSLSELRVVRLAIADADSASACNNCSETLIYALYNTNCLISQDYFNCPSSFTSSIEERKNQQYVDLTRTFRRVFTQLAYLRFDMKAQSLLYSCKEPRAANSMLDRFDSIVKKYV